ncbi:winged helix-turn-helix domain-containing protein [Thalassotalea euphylliae]|uniref:winged helix-turn-helix domain-containing protein n=1 Tax=Thalassotalea euphylliae TaxID=1655234 RepID=UPI003644F229
MQGKSKFLVGDYIVEPSHNRITLKDKEFSIEPKIMEVLCYLCEHPDKVVSKQEFLDALWPGQTLGQEVITRAIFELRKIFNDSAKSPQYISTVTRKGYCFIHPVSLPENIQKIEPSDQQSAPEVKRKINTNVMLFGLTLVVFAFAWMLLNKEFEGQHTQQNVSAETTLLSHNYQRVGQASFSANGEQLIFAAQQDDQYVVVIKTLATQQQQVVLTSDNRIVSPVLLNNNDFIYGMCETNSCDIQRFEQANGSSTAFGLSIPFLRKLALNSDATLLLLDKGGRRQRSFAIFNIAEQRFLDMPDLKDVRQPVFDAETNHVFYLVIAENGHTQLKRFDIFEQRIKPVNVEFDQVFSIANGATGQLWVSARRQGKSGIWLLDLSTSSLMHAVAATPGDVVSALEYHVATDRLVYQSNKRNIDIGIEGLPIEPKHLNSDLIDMNAVYLPQQKALVFASNRSGFYELWKATQGKVEKLTDVSANVIERPIVSTDESLLAFAFSALNKTAIRIFDIEKREIIQAAELPEKAHLLSWKKDKSGIYYSSPTKDSYAIYFLSLEDKSATTVALNAGVLYQEDDAGNHYFGNMATAHLMKQSQAGEVSSVFGLPRSALPILAHQAMVNGQRLYFANRTQQARTISSVNLQDMSESTALTLPSNAFVTQLGYDQQVFAVYDQLVFDDQQLMTTSFSPKQ